jgi:hypothetical protein
MSEKLSTSNFQRSTCQGSCFCPICAVRESNQPEELFVSSSDTPQERDGGSGGTIPATDPDLLSRLHTLRSLANDVKVLADKQRLLTIASYAAACSEEATRAIDHYNAVTPSNAAQTKA